MPYTIEIKDNKATFTVTVPAEKVTEGMKDAAEHLSEHSNIPGFRPGHATYDVVKQRVGEMKILEEALEPLIRAAFIQAMIEEDLETVGQPYFDVVKMAPDNDLIFTAAIALHPKIKKLADYKSIKIAKKDTTPSKELVEQAKKDLTGMRTKEVRKPAGAKIEKGDKAILSLGMKRDGVVLEGGESQSHGVYTGEEHYIPGFADQLIGLSEGEKKTFTLKFPKDHYQKHLSDQNVDFEIEIKEIFGLEIPVIDEEFVKGLGLTSVADLEAKLAENIKIESDAEESIRQDKEVLEALASKSDFEEISDLLVNQEIEKMLHELKNNVNNQGAEFENYLKSINKTLADLKLDFAPTALTRVKVAMILKEVATLEKIKPTDAEVDAELDKIAENYKDNKEAKETLYSPQYHDYIERQMTNRKTIDYLKSVMVK